MKSIELATSGIKKATADIAAAAKRHDVSEIPEKIKAATSAYLAETDPDYVLLLALPAGSGKTTAMVQLAEEVAAGGRRVMYAGPRHDLFDDLMEMANHPDWWLHWQPRRLGDDLNDTTCRWAPQMQRWLSRGYEAMKFCNNSRVCGWDYVQNVCPYHQQKKITRPIVYAMHQHVAVGHPLMQDIKLLIGDELPLTAFLHPWLIPTASIVVKNVEREIERLLWSMRTMCNENAPEGGWSGPALLDELGGAAHVLELLDTHGAFALDADLMTPSLRDPNSVDETDYLHLPALFSLLRQECEAALGGRSDWIRRVHCTVDGLKLLMRRWPKTLAKHVIWCDATGDEKTYERLLGRKVVMIRPDVSMAGTVYQLTASMNNRSSLTVEKISDIEKQIQRICTWKGYQNPAVITYKYVRERLKAEGHFGAERGTNRLANRDALIVVGTPMPPPESIVETTAMLLYSTDEDRRIDAFNTEWLNKDGERHRGFHNDPDLQMVLEQLREAELIQTLHRARPLRRDVDVWLLTNLPIRGIEVKEMTLQELFGLDKTARVNPHRMQKLIDWADVQIRDNIDVVINSKHIAEYLSVTQRTGQTYIRQLATSLTELHQSTGLIDCQMEYHVKDRPDGTEGRPKLTLVRQSIDLSRPTEKQFDLV